MSSETRITLEDAPPPPLPPDGPLDPHAILILDASGFRDPDQPADWSALELERATYPQTLKKLKPRVQMQVDDRLTGKPDSKLAIDVTFDKTSNFWPQQLVERVPELKQLADLIKELERLKLQMNNQPALRRRFEALLKEHLAESSPAKIAAK